MDYKKLIKTALLAGELMIKSSAETRRAEDTMSYILSLEKEAHHTVFAVATGITMSFYIKEKAYTFAIRIKDRDANLNAIYLVNDISRKLSEGLISVDFAYEKLKEIENKQLYKKSLQFLAYMCIVPCFSLALGGTYSDFLISVVVGFFFSLSYFNMKKINLNSFCIIMLCSFLASSFTCMLKLVLPFDINRELIIVSSLTSFLPGLSFTAAVRDTLNGDYISGMSRMLEAIVVALSIAVGAGSGIFIFNYIG